MRLLLVLVLLIAVPQPAVPVRSGVPVRAPSCTLPVDAAVSDGFRPPAEPWLPGNRGLTFSTEPGQPVVAVTSGVVRFAGQIAHQWYATVRLDDGTDVTYSFLSSVSVRPGDEVAIGDLIGVTGSVAFQLGHRDGATYLDPTGLVTDACGWDHAVLVPVPE